MKLLGRKPRLTIEQAEQIRAMRVNGRFPYGMRSSICAMFGIHPKTLQKYASGGHKFHIFAGRYENT